MPLENPNPIVVPQTPEKAFPHLWIYNIIIHAPSTTTGHITIETLPYNGDEQIIGEGRFVETIHTSDLWEAVNEVPEVAAAMQAIIDAVIPLKNWIDAQNQPPVIPDVVNPDVVNPDVEEPISIEN
jgi:hypothetical protein